MAMKRYALCLANDFGPDFDGGDVLPGLTYEYLGEERGMVRIVDESGEDYLYPADYFVSCPLPRQVRETLLRTRTHVRSRVRRSARVAAYTRRAGRSKR